MIDSKKILEKIKNYISKYDSIFVLENSDYTSASFFEFISQQKGKKILLLVNGQILESIPEYEMDIQIISYEEYCDIEKLYHMYEFSDHIHILDENIQYGSLGNYIINGLLTEKEIFMALLR